MPKTDGKITTKLKKRTDSPPVGAALLQPCASRKQPETNKKEPFSPNRMQIKTPRPSELFFSNGKHGLSNSQVEF